MKCFVLLFLLVICDHLPRSSSHDDPAIPTDIVFLIDGSGSISASDFAIMKQFINTIMRTLSNIDAQFSVVQYSTSVQPEFSFSDYRKAQKKEDLIDRILQLMGGTRTFSAINFVTENMFEKANGGRQEAMRILITITDGVSNDQAEAQATIQAANHKRMRRFAIGVGDAFGNRNALRELHTIASHPPENYVFAVNEFNALLQIQTQLNDRIIAIEEGFTEKSLMFGMEGTGQVMLHPLAFSQLTAFTLCMSLAAEQQRASMLFSYLLQNGDRELALVWDGDRYFTVYIACHNQTFHLPGPDALMRQVCLTWESATGMSRFWMDGKRSLGKKFGQGASIGPNGLFFLGKEQGAGGADSDQAMSFIGEIAGVNLWEHVLLPKQMRKVSQGCSGLTGNILDWSTVMYEKEGDVQVDKTDDCP